MTSIDLGTDEVLAEVRGRAGVITLNRPKAMNALNQTMVDALVQVLDQWRDDDDVAVVLLRGAGERGLCAGGDVVSLYHDAKANGTEGARFWGSEYPLNLAISQYPKPYVAIMNGIVLGGGIGVSAHGSHRIVTDDTRVGMPETGIGFVPDVGGSHLLTHVPGHLGTHLALTGAHVGAGEAIECGLADVYVPADQIEALVDELCTSGDADAVVGVHARPAPAGFTAEHDVIEQVYDHDTVEKILAALDEVDDDWARDAAKRIRRNSPLALKVTLESLRRARGQSLAEALDTEFRVSMNMQRGHDFVEGIRAQLVDKDRNPQWQPATLEEVGEADVERVFGPVDDDRITELNLAQQA
ncbi:enoyl-CoA hydratase/isomerase family protein [Luteococcus sp. OSA5]|uniref:enoyl-CoA hydratase/isomerase family protein n=1 Tax=Luteococcus sp. OSA5 TaxID=3401630 RepID=UPI003B43B727